jgi:hypothetical protein
MPLRERLPRELVRAMTPREATASLSDAFRRLAREWWSRYRSLRVHFLDFGKKRMPKMQSRQLLL